MNQSILLVMCKKEFTNGMSFTIVPGNLYAVHSHKEGKLYIQLKQSLTYVAFHLKKEGFFPYFYDHFHRSDELDVWLVLNG